MGMYYLIKSLDPTRLVVNNDGWEMTKSDICAIHNYAHGSTAEPEKQDFFRRTMQEKELLLHPHTLEEAYMPRDTHMEASRFSSRNAAESTLTQKKRTAGAYTSANSEADFLQQYEHVIHTILKSDLIYGSVTHSFPMWNRKQTAF